MSKDAEPPMRVLTGDEFDEMLRDAPPPTDDDVSITLDGRRLDSKEAVIAFFAELDAERNAVPTEGNPS